ncbi:ABC transporter ATP-binding protein [Methyloligella sp. 2.7D]|uniref:ABC transporter ATP-binding protein n=1 Tax=unclassified Methyloligella TaxID=2625955 RepID=UPI00157C33B7|nr:ABC transporter ATP-binding protein [Methyloligella sp. GL2]QKP78299.1 ABC transporter ATP-binding protein [Methyloligella sp. GL2]
MTARAANPVAGLEQGGSPPRRPNKGRTCLRVAGVSKVFPPARKGTEKITAIEPCSFDVPEGSITVLLGPSGCGKSTMLRIIAGLAEPTTGSVELDGRRVEGPGADLGMVFQSYTSFPWLTVRGNVEYGLRLAGIDGRMRRAAAEEFLKLVGLSEFADVYPSQLSGGMRQRVALARAMAPGPKILLLDEPFGALDYETRWRMQDLLHEIVAKTGLTALLVTHDIEEALYLADKVIIFKPHPGRISDEVFPGLSRDAEKGKEELIVSAEFLHWQKYLLNGIRH